MNINLAVISGGSDKTLPVEVKDWTEAPTIRPAGIHPAAKDAQAAEMARMGIRTLKPGEVSFTSPIPLIEGAEFTCDDNRRFKVISEYHGKYIARQL